MYPIFASFLIFVIFLTWSLARHKNDDRLKIDEFFERERKANETRKKPLDDLEYIQIPDTLLTPVKTHLASSVPNSSADVTANHVNTNGTIVIGYSDIPIDALDELEEYHNRLLSLSQKKIVNFTGKSNTDLKLEYGVANLNNLISYDENYTSLVQTIHYLAVCYHRIGFLKIAKEYLDFAISTHSDMCSSYMLLAKIDYKLGLNNDLDLLVKSTDSIPGSQKVTIDRKLKEFYQSHDLLHS
jgi:hypothetical protein